MRDAARKPADSKRVRDLAIVAPLVVFFLLAPPLIGLFAQEVSVFGAPLILVYLFGVWLAAILLAAWLARAMRGGGSDGVPRR